MRAFGLKLCALLLSVLMATSAWAQDPVPAKQLFGKITLPSGQRTAPIGFYAKGCLAGGIAIPVDGPAWQVIHLSRNRRWGTPQMIALIERLAREAKAEDGWNGLMIGDISQPRGGPMLSGHASHQIGLDADIWLTPMPDRKMSYQEREVIPEASVVKANMQNVNGNWTKAHQRLILRAAGYPQVERVFVNPGIKKKLCDSVQGPERALLSKIRPIWGHNYHFHIRMKCPPGSQGCDDQVDPPNDSGCGKPLADWLKMVKPRPVVAETKPKKPVKATKPKYLALSNLPDACAVVLKAPSVASMEVAEYHGDGTMVATAQVPVPVTAFAEPQPMLREVSVTDDYAIFVPALGSVPFPLPRPSM